MDTTLVGTYGEVLPTLNIHTEGLDKNPTPPVTDMPAAAALTAGALATLALYDLPEAHGSPVLKHPRATKHSVVQ